MSATPNKPTGGAGDFEMVERLVREVMATGRSRDLGTWVAQFHDAAEETHHPDAQAAVEAMLSAEALVHTVARRLRAQSRGGSAPAATTTPQRR